MCGSARRSTSARSAGGPVPDRPHKNACHSCGGDMSDGQLRRQEFDERINNKMMAELDSVYAHLRAVIENCKTADVAAIRHQLVGLLPEVQPCDPDLAERLRANGMGHLVERASHFAQDAWAGWGYPEEQP